jgi:hypothetical protein
MYLSWNAEEPPADPPAECREPALWQESYRRGASTSSRRRAFLCAGNRGPAVEAIATRPAGATEPRR